MVISTDHYSVKALFEQKQTFVVPKYQRGYAWEDEAVNDFIEDISKCLVARREGRERHHFFGGVVTVRQEVHGSTRDNYEVIDGQQRLASFVLLAGCIIKHIESTIAELENKESSESLNDDEKKAKNYLIETVSALKRLYLKFRDNKGIEYSDVSKLILSKADKDFFLEVISDQGPEPERESHKRILFAWENISNFVQSELVDASLSASDKAKKIQQFLDDVLGKDCTAIFMCSDTKSEAYQIFQVLNDRGAHLGKGDLLRARTLELLDDEHEVTQNRVADNWDDVLAYTPDSIDNYLSWYFSSMEGRRPKPVDLVDEFLEYRFKCEGRESVTTQEADRILTEVEQVNAAFSTLDTVNEGEWPYPDHRGVASWDRERLRILVKSLKHTNAMPLLLSLTELAPKVFAEAVACIERFVFRYKTVVNAHVGPMTKVYLKHAKAIRDSGTCDIKSLRADLSKLIDRYAPDSIFEPAIREIKFSPKSGKNIDIRYFFITIEDYASWYDSGAQGRPKCKNKTRVFDFGETTIEHVYPQKPAVGDKDCELEIVKHALGNLTILGPEDNNALANRHPDQKLQAFAQSSLKLNRDIAKNDGWTKAKVDERTKDLAAIALKIFVP